MLLKNLLPQDLSIQGSELETSSIEIDSRKVQKNSIFFALKGTQSNGVDFIDSAIQNGAKIIVCDQNEDPKIPAGIILLKSTNPHSLLVFMLRKFYANLPKNIFAVTGTNGKTSVADFCRQILEILGHKAAVIGTLGVTIDDSQIKEKIIGNSLTTPDLITFYKNLVILKQNNVDFVIVETSSIGLEQGRIDGIEFQIGAFTNFTIDHLDYHKNMDQYFAAKMILFNKVLAKSKLAILNDESDKFAEILQISKENELKIVTYGSKNADFAIISSKEQGDFREILLEINGKKYDFKISLLEDFQVSNIVCALAMIASYFKLSQNDLLKLSQKLVDLTAVNGRMEKVATLKNNAKIYIDFAHTPDALENILKTTKKHSKARILVVFGCGGDRDATKRPIMGKIAANLADFAIITDDNPRTENSGNIRKEIIAGIEKDFFNKILEVGDRREAIKKAISLLEKDDILIVAGKGHENYQIIGKEKRPFDEREIINNCK
jgi:UDP-N-acetylmuramoyl-L-alanyl-D-glutamate--2,6-diaminopimelate ligase